MILVEDIQNIQWLTGTHAVVILFGSNELDRLPDFGNSFLHELVRDSVGRIQDQRTFLNFLKLALSCHSSAELLSLTCLGVSLLFL